MPLGMGWLLPEMPQEHTHTHTVRPPPPLLRSFIELVANYLRLLVQVHQGRELVPTISQRGAWARRPPTCAAAHAAQFRRHVPGHSLAPTAVLPPPRRTLPPAAGDDLQALLVTLALMLEPGALLRCRAFHGEPPSNATGWDAAGLGSWAAVPPGAAPAEGPAVAAAADTYDIDLTEDPPALPPETPSHQAAAHAWQAAMVDCFGAWGGWELMLQVRSAWPWESGGHRSELHALPAGVARPCAHHCSHTLLPMQLLSQPERLGDYLWAFLGPLGPAVKVMLPDRRGALVHAALAATAHVRAGLEAAADVSAVEGSAAHPESRVSQVLTCARAILTHGTSAAQAEAEVRGGGAAPAVHAP